MAKKRYFAFEGSEGSGKTTLTKAVITALSSHPHNMDMVAVREPGGTRMGDAIRRILLNWDSEVSVRTEALLFAASRAQLIEQIIKPALGGGKIVISDRSAISSLAYQGFARGLGVDHVRDINDFALDGLWPDLTILLDIDTEVGLSREKTPDRISDAGLEFHKKLNSYYRKLAEENSERIVVISAELPLDDVIQKSIQIILNEV